MTEQDKAEIKARWDELERRALLTISAEKRAIILQAHTDIRALLADIYALQWGAPERIGPRQWRWPAQDEEVKP